MTGDCSGPTFSTSLMSHLSWAVPFPRYRLSVCTCTNQALCLCSVHREEKSWEVAVNNILPTENNAGPFPSFPLPSHSVLKS